MKVKLNPWERFMLQQLLVQKTDNVMAMRMLREFREELCFTKDEMGWWKVNDTMTAWETCPDCDRASVRNGQEAELTCDHPFRLKEFTLPKPLEKQIYDLLHSKDEAKQVTFAILSLVEKFCYAEDEPSPKEAPEAK